LSPTRVSLALSPLTWPRTAAISPCRYRDTLSRLRYLTVHNDAIFVWHRGPFVTLNGCRLGRLPGLPVDWPEMNAALGQMAMLLATISGRTGFRFTK
jgi:hypothetical protein